MFTKVQLQALVAVVGFCTLQFLPHQITWLSVDLWTVLYMLMAALLGLVVVFGALGGLLSGLLTRDPNQRRDSLQWCVTCAVMIVLGLATTLGSHLYSRGLPIGSFAKRFDRQLWLEPAAVNYVRHDITERQKMLGDTIASAVMDRTKDQIVDFLGPSTGDVFRESGRDLIYPTGPQRDALMRIDTEWLLIWLDANGRCQRWEIWSD